MMDTTRFVSKNACLIKRKIIINNGNIIFRCEKTAFDEALILKILQFSDQILNECSLNRLQVHFLFSNDVVFSDKLIYVLFECVCHQLILRGHPVYVKMSPKFQITTHGYYSSPLLLLSTGKRSHVEKFMKKFQHDLYGNHFRMILPNDAKSSELSSLMDDIATFQKPFDIKEDEREKITEVLTELVGNAVEHTTGDCLIDLDITDIYEKHGADGKSYRGINIVILNFSAEFLGTSLKIKLNAPGNLTERYKQVQRAYDTHQSYFCATYLPDDFYNIATFQHKISGRLGNQVTGGTGLTKLIRSLEEDSDAYRCHVISGQRLLIFEKEYMSYNENNWIGFNGTNDFLGAPPETRLLRKNTFIIPGTAYNLTFVMEVT